MDALALLSLTVEVWSVPGTPVLCSVHVFLGCLCSLSAHTLQGTWSYRAQVASSWFFRAKFTCHHGMALRAGVLLPEKCQVVQAVALVVTTKPSSLG
jgi:hypothetical protein